MADREEIIELKDQREGEVVHRASSRPASHRVALVLAILACVFATVVAVNESRPGKSFPDNLVYRALLAANDKAQTQNKKSPIPNCMPYDVTDTFRESTKGESFSQIKAEFEQLGMKSIRDSATYPTQPVPGKDYLLTLLGSDIRALSIPDSFFDMPFACDQCFSLVVTLHLNTESDYSLLKATVNHCPIPL